MSSQEPSLNEVEIKDTTTSSFAAAVDQASDEGTPIGSKTPAAAI